MKWKFCFYRPVFLGEPGKVFTLLENCVTKQRLELGWNTCPSSTVEAALFCYWFRFYLRIRSPQVRLAPRVIFDVAYMPSDSYKFDLLQG